MKLVVVESPAKAKTINKYLGKDFQVLASFGHVRDLPAKNGSVQPDQNFLMAWEVNADSKKQIKAISSALKNAEKLILATDPDREGEAISWHVAEILKKNKQFKNLPIERVSFNAVTPEAVLEAFKNPREIDMQLVHAYLARRALDYLVGFNLSPVLWRKLPGAKSAGRVQSVALRLICKRETEIESFKPREYWSIEAILKTQTKENFKAKLHALDNKKLEKFSLTNQQEAQQAKIRVEQAMFRVSHIESKPVKRSPSPPFITSTLQQEAARKLGFSTLKTMSIAQQLYEGVTVKGKSQGLITYMRTDSPSMTPTASQQCHNVIGQLFGNSYQAEKIRHFRKKVKNAQEAHEAIRPTDFTLHPDNLPLNQDQKKLYTLIWKRAIASQMAEARLERTTLDLQAVSDHILLRATGSVQIFDGFLKVYQEGKDHEKEEEHTLLPAVKKEEPVNIENVNAQQHFTQPPPRYSEASLVKAMEELGIGRPSTYASTLTVLQNRDYVHMEKKRFIPDDKGRLVIAFLENFFLRYFEYNFTANLEEQLDAVSSGAQEWTRFLETFWNDFKITVEEVKNLKISEVLDKLNEYLQSYLFPETDEKQNARKCPECETGQLSLKTSRYGAFIGCSNYPECKFTRPFNTTSHHKDHADHTTNSKDKILGKDPQTGMDIILKTGRFGPYVEYEDHTKRMSLPKNWSMDSITLEQALKLLSLPRQIGIHPESGKNIQTNLGRYGPYLQHEKTYVTLTNIEELFDIGMNHAIALLVQKENNQTKNLMRDLGAHPEDGEPIQILKGRYGPYIKYKKINVSLGKSIEMENMDLQTALKLIEKKISTKTKKKQKPSA